MQNINSSHDIIIANPKLEIGNIATDWTPAPEDMQVDLSPYATNSSLNEFKQAQATQAQATVTAVQSLREFVIDYYDFEHLNYYAQAVFYLIASSFGMLIFGIFYRSIQLTFTDKKLSEIVTEIKEITKALIK